MGLAQIENEKIAEIILSCMPKLKNKDSIQNTVKRAEIELEPYKEYLE